jgi:hypothetical protein
LERRTQRTLARGDRSVRIFRSLLPIAVVLLGFSGVTRAGDATGIVQEVHLGPVYGTRVFLRIAGSVTAQPGCHANYFHFVFDSSVSGGKELLSAALAARTSQASVKISGYNTCTQYTGVEDLRWLTLE